MLVDLSIKNYALITALEVNFGSGMTTITGETGAGKSLLLGALGLLLGKRADVSVVKDTNKKCILEASFAITSYGLHGFFEKEDLEYDEQTIIRREILPSGKSRAFVNDSPVNLQILSKLGSYLIDIHSQHQTLSIANEDFQFTIIDALAGTLQALASYKRGLSLLKVQKQKLKEIKERQANASQEYDYQSFLYEELVKADLKKGELAVLEENFKALNNVEMIKAGLSLTLGTIQNEEFGIQDQLGVVQRNLRPLTGFTSDLLNVSNRIDSLSIELEDVVVTLQNLYDAMDTDPEQLEKLNNRLQLLHDLQKKHAIGVADDLIEIRNQLETKVKETDNMDEAIAIIENELFKITGQLDLLAAKIHDKRCKAIPKLKKGLESTLKILGMPNASFDIQLDLSDTYFENGKDKLSFLFAANKGTAFGALKKVASGGELSRIMLAVKRILSDYKSLPTIIFDEIDTGVSGEIADKMADLMLEMSANVQLFSITHLPQIAAKGQAHYKVYKEDKDNETFTQVKILTPTERIQEIAQMLSGAKITDSAKNQAKELLLEAGIPL